LNTRIGAIERGTCLVVVLSSQKNYPHRQADKRGDAEGDEGKKNLAHQTITEAKGT